MKPSNRWKEQIPTLCIIGAQMVAIIAVALFVMENPPAPGVDPFTDLMDSVPAVVTNVAQATSL